MKKSQQYRKYLWLVPLFAILAFATACSGGGGTDTAQNKSQKQTERYTEDATSDVKYPEEEMKAGGWLERRNLRERLIRYADANKISYIYLLTKQGQLWATYTVKGKVSNTSSQMTTPQIVNDVCGEGCTERFQFDAPMDDGTWGPSEDAIFFFTPEGVMIQWNGDYQLADAPQDLTSKPLLVYSESSKPTSVGDEKQYGGN